MKMRHLVLVGVAVAFMFTGCQRGGNNLVVWSFTDEIEGMISMFNVGEALGMEIEYSMTPTDQFPDRLDPVLVSGRGVPDVFALEAAFVRRYVESGLLLDLTDLYNEVRGSVIRYPIEIATVDGKVYGMSWQATPGALFYRRSLAIRHLGTDDPDVVQTYFNNWENFLATAQMMSETSGGSTRVISAVDELNNPFMSSRTQPWVVNGRLVIDPAMMNYLQMARYLRDNNLDGLAQTWAESWFAGMRGDLTDASGNPIEVFSYLLPTWGLHYVLAQNAGDTAGDWAMIPGPAPWFWGGTWLAAYEGTSNPEAAKNFIRALTTNEDNLYRWASETGDFLNNLNVINRIKDTFSMPFLGGQNHYAAFVPMAETIDATLIQGTDQAINALFLEALNQYVNDESTLDQAIAMFRDQVRTQLGIE